MIINNTKSQMSFFMGGAAVTHRTYCEQACSQSRFRTSVTDALWSSACVDAATMSLSVSALQRDSFLHKVPAIFTP